MLDQWYLNSLLMVTHGYTYLKGQHAGKGYPSAWEMHSICLPGANFSSKKQIHKVPTDRKEEQKQFTNRPELFSYTNL